MTRGSTRRGVSLSGEAIFCTVCLAPASPALVSGRGELRPYGRRPGREVVLTYLVAALASKLGLDIHMLQLGDET